MKLPDEIMNVFKERKTLQDKTLGEGYPLRLATWNIRLTLQNKFPHERFYCYDLRRVLKQLEQDGKVFKCPHKSRRGQAVWRLVDEN